MSNQTINRAVDALMTLKDVADEKRLDLGLLVQVYCARKISDSVDCLSSDLDGIQQAVERIARQ